MLSLNKAFIIILSICVPAFGWTQSLNKSLDLSLKDKLGSMSIEVHVFEQTDSCRFAVQSYEWGAEGACPKKYIQSLEIKNGLHDLFVPISVFSDLGNPTKVTLNKLTKLNQYVAVIEGGDAGSSYRAKIIFNKDRLLQRSVESRSFPKEANETTIYKFNFDTLR